MSSQASSLHPELLKFALQYTTASAESESGGALSSQTAADREWLSHALDNIESKSQKHARLLKYAADEEAAESERVAALRELQESSEDFDDALEISQRGAVLFRAMLLSSSAPVRAWSAYVCGTAAKDNGRAVTAFLAAGVLEALMIRLVVEREESVLSKLIGCLSALVGQSGAARHYFGVKRGATLFRRVFEHCQLAQTRAKALFVAAKIVQCDDAAVARAEFLSVFAAPLMATLHDDAHMTLRSNAAHLLTILLTKEDTTDASAVQQFASALQSDYSALHVLQTAIERIRERSKDDEDEQARREQELRRLEASHAALRSALQRH